MTIKEYTIRSQTSKVKYSVMLFIDESGEFVPEKSSCTCAHGSFYRFTKTNLASNNWKCFHVKLAIEKYKKKEPDNIEMEKKGGKHGKTKPIHPIFQ